MNRLTSLIMFGIVLFMGTSTATVAEETESSSTILIEDASFRGDGGDEGDGGDGEDFSASDATMSHNLVIESVHPDSTMGEERQHPMAQITNVSELRDVQPTDWAYEALRSLIQRYDCIAGYPDDTYRGNVALTRFEFAAGLNACLQLKLYPLVDRIVVNLEIGVTVATQISLECFVDRRLDKNAQWQPLLNYLVENQLAIPRRIWQLLTRRYERLNLVEG